MQHFFCLQHWWWKLAYFLLFLSFFAAFPLTSFGFFDFGSSLSSAWISFSESSCEGKLRNMLKLLDIVIVWCNLMSFSCFDDQITPCMTLICHQMWQTSSSPSPSSSTSSNSPHKWCPWMCTGPEPWIRRKVTGASGNSRNDCEKRFSPTFNTAIGIFVGPSLDAVSTYK